MAPGYALYSLFLNLYYDPGISSNHCRDFKYYIREVKRYDYDHDKYKTTEYEVRRFHLTSPLSVGTVAEFSKLSHAWDYMKQKKRIDGKILKKKKKTRLVRKDEIIIDEL